MQNYLSITDPSPEGSTVTLPPGGYRIGDPMQLFTDDFIDYQWRDKELRTGVFYDLRDETLIGAVTPVQPGDGTYHGKEWGVFDASVYVEPRITDHVRVTTKSGTLAIVNTMYQTNHKQGHFVFAEHGGVALLGPTLFVIRTPFWQLRMNIK